MTLENQTPEWKESWRDDCLTTICAFANTGGGVLEIGRRNNGKIVGVDNLKKLLEDLPNKIRSATGVVPDVDVRESDGKQYIAIHVPQGLESTRAVLPRQPQRSDDRFCRRH